jgi:2-hydroxychromene-2-carboxylate isomerase
MTGKTIEFIFDFGSPNAYLVWQVLPALAERTGATITLTPCLLGGLFKITGNQPPFVAFGGIQGKMAYERLEIDRFIRRHRLDRFRFNPHFPVNTLALMRGMIAAQDMGLERPYLEAGLRAMWEDGRKMDDPVELLAVLDAAGLDGAAIAAASQDQAVKDRLAANTAAAAERGVFGIPSFFVGDEMFFGKERLGQIEELLTQPQA